jgi:hypothetical protein
MISFNSVIVTYTTVRNPNLAFWVQVISSNHVPGGLGCAVGIVACYGLDGSGIESWCGRNFLRLSRPGLGHTQPPMQRVPGLFPGGKAARASRWLPTPSSAEFKERVELSLYSPSGSSWSVVGWTLPLEPRPCARHENTCGGGGLTLLRPIINLDRTFIWMAKLAQRPHNLWENGPPTRCLVLEMGKVPFACCDSIHDSSFSHFVA